MEIHLIFVTFSKGHGVARSNSQDSDGESDATRNSLHNEVGETAYTPGARRKISVCFRTPLFPFRV